MILKRAQTLSLCQSLKRRWRQTRDIEQAGFPDYSLPAGHRAYAIGDVHGRLDLLNQLLDQIAEDDARRPPAQTSYIFVGDLINRGPESAGVLARVRALQDTCSVRLIAGNHEEMFLRALNENAVMRDFLRFGGKETILSYGVSADALRDMTFEELQAALLERIPLSDFALLRAMEDRVALGGYLFVHAGVRPDIPLDQQSVKDLRWIREPFLSSRTDQGAMIIHGHTIKAVPDIQSNRIGIDTGAFSSGRLTALGLEGDKRWFLSTKPWTLEDLQV